MSNSTAVSQRTVPLTQVVVVDGFNPRQTFDDTELTELVASIKERGVLQPLRVAPVNGGGSYRLIAGERRFRASQLAGLTEVPVIVDAGDRDEQELLVDAVVENLHRSDLNPMEEALAYQRLKDAGLAQRGIVEKVRKPAAHVRERLALLKLPSTVWPRVEDRSLPLLATDAVVVLETIHAGLGELCVNAMLSQDSTDPFTWAELVDDPLATLLSLVESEQLPADVFLAGRHHRYPLDAFELSEKAQRDAAKLAELRERPVEAWSFTETDFDAAQAIGAAHATSDGWRGRVIVGAEVAAQLVADAISRELKAERARAREAQQRGASNGSSDTTQSGSAQDAERQAAEEAQRAAAEREAEQAARLKAAAFNERLGAALVGQLSRVKVDTRVMTTLTSVDLAANLTQVAMRGARYGFPGWVPPIADGERTVHYLSHADALAKAQEYLAGAKTPGDVAGRCLALIAMAIFADETAVAPSNRTGHVVQVGATPWQEQVGEWIDELVTEHVPARMLARQVKERKARREAEQAKRAAVAKLRDTVAALAGAEQFNAAQLDELEQTAKDLLGEYSSEWFEIRRQIQTARENNS